MSADWSGSQNIEIRDCVVVGGSVGVNFSGGASGSVHDCQFADQSNYGISKTGLSAMDIVDNYIEQDDGIGLFISGSGLFSGHDNVVISNLACISLYTDGPLDFHNNHFLRGPGTWFVHTTTYYPGPADYADFSHNWWGTTDLDEIDEWIYDGNDDDSVNLYVDYQPILGGPVETEQTTWSELKNMYR